MIYQEFECHPSLASRVLCYWKFEIPLTQANEPFSHFVLPDGCPSVVYFSLPQFNVKSSVLVGPTKYITERQVHPGSKFIGVRLRPALLSSLYGLDGNSLRDQNVSPAPSLGLDDAAIFNAIDNDSVWIAAFNQQLSNIPIFQQPVNLLVADIANTILVQKGRLSISDLIESTPKSVRQLQKLFKKEVGLTMKEFAVALRVRASVIDLEHHKVAYQDAVHDQGYFDQAHFIRDFTKLSKIPLPDFKRYIQAIEHIGVDYRS